MFAPRVFGICLRYARDHHEADDMAQEAWILAFSKLKQFQGDGVFAGWLHRLTVNSCLQFLRKRRMKIIEQSAEELSLAATNVPQILQFDATQLSNMSVAELVDQISKLPEGFRLVFNLVAIEGYSHAEAAEALGINESTSRSQLTRARVYLQKRLSKLITVCL